MKIRRVTLEDLDELIRVGKQTFTETFSSENTEENMTEYLKKNFSVEKLKAELTDKYSEFYFIETTDTPIGYLKINFEQSQTEIKKDNTLEIERIYVLKAFQGRDFGQELYNKALEIAKVKGVEYVWLGVWEKNSRAIRFYKRNGFVEFDKHIFKLGNDEQTDIMMKLKVE